MGILTLTSSAQQLTLPTLSLTRLEEVSFNVFEELTFADPKDATGLKPCDVCSGDQHPKGHNTDQLELVQTFSSYYDLLTVPLLRKLKAAPAHKKT